MNNEQDRKPATPKTSSQKIPFIDLFCGAGGLSVGFERAGFQSVYALDNDSAAIGTFKANHPDTATVCVGIEDVTAKDIYEASGYDYIPLIVGGPNCQGVSLRGKRNPNDEKNQMFFHFHRLISEMQPEWFVMENVPGLLHRHNRELVSDIFKAFEDIGYSCGADVLLAADYGVPQLRYRLFLIGNRIGAPVNFPAPTHACPFDQLGIGNVKLFDVARPSQNWVTVNEAIGDLPNIENGGGKEQLDGYFQENIIGNKFLDWSKGESTNLLNHVCHKTNEANINLIKHIAQGKNWKSIPEEIRPARFKRVALKDHTTTYGRLSWNMPSRTITCYFNNITCGAFTHPEQHRGISVREGARLQSFPDDFRFMGTLSRQYRQVGNAVPSLLAYHIATTLKESMTGVTSLDDSYIDSAVIYSKHRNDVVFNRPVKGMRFNLDKYLVTS